MTKKKIIIIGLLVTSLIALYFVRGYMFLVISRLQFVSGCTYPLETGSCAKCIKNSGIITHHSFGSNCQVKPADAGKVCRWDSECRSGICVYSECLSGICSTSETNGKCSDRIDKEGPYCHRNLFGKKVECTYIIS